MNRVPLASISSNHRRHTQYTPYQKGIIAGAIGSGLTPSRVQKAFRVPESSVRYVLSKAHNIDDHAAPRSGRPKKLSTRDERHILRIVR